MHHRLLVLTNKKDYKTSEEARRHVYNVLIDDTSFLSEGGGLFGSSVADWFVIGGRWSGALSRALMKKDFFKECEKKIKPEHDFGYSSTEIEDAANQAVFQEIWEEMGGDDVNPYNRSSYDHNGAEDDAKILTKRLWDKLIKPLIKDKEHYRVDYHKIVYTDEWSEPSVVDLEYDNIDSKAIATKWIVVVDYHN